MKDQIIFNSFSIAELDEMIAKNNHNESIATGSLTGSAFINYGIDGLATALMAKLIGPIATTITVATVLALLEVNSASLARDIDMLKRGGHHGISIMTYFKFDGWGTGGPSSGYPTYKAYKIRDSVY